MTPRRRAILVVAIILALILIVVAGILLLLSGTRKVSPPTQTAPVDTGSQETAPPQAAAAPANPLSPVVVKPSGQTAAAQLAELFAERYGSYSTESDYQNLRDLLPIMTDAFRKRTEAFLADAPSTNGQPYEGVTSVKVSTRVESFSEASGQAVFSVTLQQEKSTAASAPVVSYRTLRVELREVAGAWKVASAEWEN